jgi:hypothetical protein
VLGTEMPRAMLKKIWSRRFWPTPELSKTMGIEWDARVSAGPIPSVISIESEGLEGCGGDRTREHE